MNRNFLSEILAEKRQVVARLQYDSFPRGFRERALEIRRNATPHRLLRALEADLPRLKIIAEFKRRSPSLGIIRDDLSAADVARRYERGGACAISVLTDEEYFGGSLEDLSAARSSAKLPVLRKDFIIDPIQIYEAAIAGADAVLLIVAALDDDCAKSPKTNLDSMRLSRYIHPANCAAPWIQARKSLERTIAI